MKLYATRLQAGEDLKIAITDFVKAHQLSSATIMSAVGSLSAVRMRMAGAQPERQDIREYKGAFEIVSPIGTVTSAGALHLHVAVADSDGQVLGGHLKEGCIVHTTVELVIASDPDLTFTRALDASTGFDELHISASS